MNFDLARIIESKRAHRRELAARPIGEKLRILDSLRERELTLRGSRTTSSALQEEPVIYRTSRR